MGGGAGGQVGARTCTSTTCTSTSTTCTSRDLRGRTPLWLAVSGQHEGCVGVLVAAGAEVGVEDSAGVAVLGLARTQGVRERLHQA